MHIDYRVRKRDEKKKKQERKVYITKFKVKFTPKIKEKFTPLKTSPFFSLEIKHALLTKNYP